MTLSKKDADRIMAKVEAMRNRAWNLGVIHGDPREPRVYDTSQAYLDELQNEIQRALYPLVDEESADLIDDETTQYAIWTPRPRHPGEYVRLTLAEAGKHVGIESIQQWLTEGGALQPGEKVMRRTRLTQTEAWEGWEEIQL